jgi:hypothetical protein
MASELKKKQWTKPTVESVSVEPDEDLLAGCQSPSASTVRSAGGCGPLKGNCAVS